MGFGMSDGKKGPKGFADAVDARYPGLVRKVKNLIEESERGYAKKTGGAAGSFLWEHTIHVTSLAYDLALAEGFDPVTASVVALFHDAGKFVEGGYHEGDRAEEEDSATLARAVLGQAGAGKGGIARVERALRALYEERAAGNRAAAIVHDADFLAKFGALGVAGFFIKSALRGRNLEGAIGDSLSKELTYASVLALNMRTRSGRKMAVKKSADSLRYFRSLLRELKNVHGIEYRIRTVQVRIPGGRRGPARVRLVVPAACPSCGAAWSHALRVEPGLKCRKLLAAINCRGCGAGREIAFCLPEIPGAGA